MPSQTLNTTAIPIFNNKQDIAEVFIYINNIFQYIELYYNNIFNQLAEYNMKEKENKLKRYKLGLKPYFLNEKPYNEVETLKAIINKHKAIYTSKLHLEIINSIMWELNLSLNSQQPFKSKLKQIKVSKY